MTRRDDIERELEEFKEWRVKNFQLEEYQAHLTYGVVLLNQKKYKPSTP